MYCTWSEIRLTWTPASLRWSYKRTSSTQCDTCDPLKGPLSSLRWEAAPYTCFSSTKCLLFGTLMSSAPLSPFSNLLLSLAILFRPSSWCSLVLCKPNPMAFRQSKGWGSSVISILWVSLPVERYDCFQSACFLPRYNTTGYLPQQVSTILRCMWYSFLIHVSRPWFPFFPLCHCRSFYLPAHI